MQINPIIKDEDIVEKIQLTMSPAEYLVVSAALKRFAEDPDANAEDIEVAKGMRKNIETVFCSSEIVDKVNCAKTDCANCVNHKYCDYEPTMREVKE